jgi:hypothetical protein
MNSKRLKITAIAIIVIIILASLAIVLWNGSPKPSQARSMILVADDARTKDARYWDQEMVGDENSREQNTTSQAYSDMRNESISSVEIELLVYNNESNCHSAFPSMNTTEHPIGDESVYWNSSDHIFLAFREVNVAVWISLNTVGSYTWLYESAVYLAELQLQKIDQFMSH